MNAVFRGFALFMSVVYSLTVPSPIPRRTADQNNHPRNREADPAFRRDEGRIRATTTTGPGKHPTAALPSSSGGGGTSPLSNASFFFSHVSMLTGTDGRTDRRVRRPSEVSSPNRCDSRSSGDHRTRSGLLR